MATEVKWIKLDVSIPGNKKMVHIEFYEGRKSWLEKQ